MSKTYSSKTVAQVQATKASKKLGVEMDVFEAGGGWTFAQKTVAPIGWREVDTSVNEVADAEQPIVVEARKPEPVKLASTVTLSFPLSQLQPAYLECWHDGKLTWFAKDSLEAWAVAGDEGVHPMVTLTMARHKAVRRRLVQPAA